MYSLLTEFRDGDNVVTTMLEHNSNFVPWHALCREILPRFGRRVECRLARFDHGHRRARPGSPGLAGGRADQAGLLHRRVELPGHQAAAGRGPGDRRRAAATRSPTASGGPGCWSTARSWCPSSFIDVQALDVDYLSFSFHKLLAPFGVGVLYAKEHLLRHVAAVPLRRRHDRRGAGRPGPRRLQRAALEVLRRHPEHPRASSSPRRRCGWPLDLVRAPARAGRTSAPSDPVPRMPSPADHGPRSRGHTAMLTERAHRRAWRTVRGSRIYGPAGRGPRHPLVAFNVAGRSPFELADALNEPGWSRGPAATAPRWPTTTSAWTRRPAAGSASTCTTPSTMSIGPWTRSARRSAEVAVGNRSDPRAHRRRGQHGRHRRRRPPDFVFHGGPASSPDRMRRQFGGRGWDGRVGSRAREYVPGNGEPDITIRETRVYRGPNYYSYEPAVHMVVDIGRLEQFPTDTLPGFTESLLDAAARAARPPVLPRPGRRLRRAAGRGHLGRARRRARRAGAPAHRRPRDHPRQDPIHRRGRRLQRHLRLPRRDRRHRWPAGSRSGWSTTWSRTTTCRRRLRLHSRARRHSCGPASGSPSGRPPRPSWTRPSPATSLGSG